MGTFTKIGKLRIASLLDIGVNKIQAVMARNRARDYFDLDNIMQKLPINTKTLQRQYRMKFDVHIDEDQLAKRFVAVLDAQDQPRFLGKVNWKHVEQFFLEQAEQLGKTLLQ